VCQRDKSREGSASYWEYYESARARDHEDSESEDSGAEEKVWGVILSLSFADAKVPFL